jgi:mercuric reductase
MKYELQIDGMTCLDCARTLEHALASAPGVEHTAVSYPSKRATVIAGSQVGAETLRDVIAQTGYRATIIGDEAAEATPASVATPAPSSARAAALRRVRSGDAERHGGEGGEYDLLIVGTGGAGVAAAIRASELGATAAIVEHADVIGGTCVNVGCIPSKNLIEAAHHYHAARTGFPGIAPCEPQLAWEQVLRQKRELVESLRQQKYTDVLQAYEGITLLRGHAELRPSESDGAVAVRVGDRVLRARGVVLATGTRPALPPIPGLAEAGALDSATVMELERLPASLLVLGAGSIGLELGQAFQRFGVRVIVVEAMDRVLPAEDPEI